MGFSLLAPLRKRVRIDGVAQYHQGELFYPGSASLVYESDFVNPVEDLYGPAYLCGNPPSPLQPPPVLIPQPLGIVTGMPNSVGNIEFAELTEVS